MNSQADRPFPPIEGVEVTHRFIDIGGLKVHVAEAGAGEPLLMMHGWPQNWWMWRKQIPHFAQRFRVIVPDIRGFGWTEAPPSGYTMDELADDLVRLVRTLGYNQIRLLSHDWGGWIGYIASAKNPGVIAQHFATNVPPIWPKLDYHLIPATLRLGYMARIAMPYFGQRMLMRNGDFVHHMFKRDGTGKEWTAFEKNIFSDQFKDPARAKASTMLYRDFLVKDYIPLGFGKYNRYHLKTPTRILFGEKDFAVALSWLRGYEKYVDDLQIERIPDVGHFIVDERPDLVNDRAMKFFTHSNRQAS